jgi:hypothetical protein
MLILDSVASVLLVNSTPFSYWFSAGHQQPAIAAVAFEPAVTTAGHVNAHFFYLAAPATCNFISAYIGVGQPGATLNVGIYDPNGNLLIDSGAIAATGSGVVVRNAPVVGAGLTLKAGWYYYAFSSNSTVATFLAQNQNNIAAYYALAGGAPRNVLASTLETGGALPLSLGNTLSLVPADSVYHPTILFSQL